jgi:hypothetical protein
MLDGSLEFATEFSSLNPVLGTKTKPAAREWVFSFGIVQELNCRIRI